MESLEYILKAERIAPIDVPYLIRGEKKSHFGISTGIGYDAGVCQEVLATPLKKVFNRLGLGKLIYLFIALKQLIFISPGKMTVTLDGENTFSYDHVYFTAVMNQRYEGGGFKFCPDARPDDGQLDMILVEGVGKLKLLFCLPTAFFGKHVGIRGIHILTYLHIPPLIKLINSLSNIIDILCISNCIIRINHSLIIQIKKCIVH